MPALLFEARSRTDAPAPPLAAALARAWAYSGQPARAAGFAAEAQADAERRGDPTLLADALDAQLAVHWGPDQLADRLRLTDRLEEAAAHLTDVEARLSAQLWRLSTGLEVLDSAAVRRQLRALDLLATESGSARVAFFAASRRGMHALLTGDLDAARAAMADAGAAGRAAGSPDVEAVEHTLRAGIARQAGDTAALVAEARNFEGYGLAEGIRSITAWAANHWAAAGHPDRARAVLHQLADFATIPRDVDWLLTVYLLTEVAAAVGERAQAEAGLALLTPYAGRGVIDAGGVAFVGVVDAALARAGASSTVPTTPPGGRRARGRLPAHGRDLARVHTPATAPSRQADPPVGARRRSRRVRGRPGAVGDPTLRTRTATAPSPGSSHLRPGDDGIWWVGRDGGPSAVRDVRGLHYLHLLLSRPGLDVPALALSDAVAGNVGARAVDGDAGPLLDRQALAAYRRRLGELDDELAEARAHADLAREQRLDQEREALLDQLRAATGLGGRARVAGGTHERARVAVRKAIAAAIDRIAAVDPSLGRLLVDTVSTGATCRYEPDPDRPVRWVLSRAHRLRQQRRRCATDIAMKPGLARRLRPIPEGVGTPPRSAQTPRDTEPSAATSAGSPSISTRTASRPNPCSTSSPGSPVIVTDRSACLATIRSPRRPRQHHTDRAAPVEHLAHAAEQRPQLAVALRVRRRGAPSRARPRRASSWWTKSSPPLPIRSNAGTRNGDQSGGPERSSCTRSAHGVVA